MSISVPVDSPSDADPVESGDEVEHEPVPVDGGEVVTPRQAAAEIFSRRLGELIAESVVATDDGVSRSLTLYSLAKHLELAYPDVPISQSGLYRLINGEAIPRLDLIIALARVFDVPPEFFVTTEEKT
ncbi:helix-turn-helix domain-containing protein [Nocardia sp. NPDC006044]|uniref:helix-turn-helix domain-containing protein n=1 Tax=Nocardia sp. NPDC006044 TaxID=3364306 RepID=UPI00369F767E